MQNTFFLREIYLPIIIFFFKPSFFLNNVANRRCKAFLTFFSIFLRFLNTTSPFQLQSLFSSNTLFDILSTLVEHILPVYPSFFLLLQIFIIFLSFRASESQAILNIILFCSLLFTQFLLLQFIVNCYVEKIHKSECT